MAAGGGGASDPMAPPGMEKLSMHGAQSPGSQMFQTGGPLKPMQQQPQDFRALLQQLLGQGMFSPSQLGQQPLPVGPATQTAQNMVQHTPNVGVPSAHAPGMFVPPAQQPSFGGSGPRSRLVRSLLA